jgi:ribosomal protein S18 acetylase RimI-like enzyme
VNGHGSQSSPVGCEKRDVVNTVAAFFCPMVDVSWQLRPAQAEDREFLYALNEVTMREHVEKVWGWDDSEQLAFFDDRFQPADWQIIQADREDVGVLIVRENDDELYLEDIKILPAWQGRGIGSAVVRSLMRDAVSRRKPLTLRVLHVNTSARALYERLGFRPFKEIETHTYLRWDG